jgi:hypothetical protein
MGEEKRKVSLDDVVEVLAKHAGTPNDPDDAETISLFNEQVTEARAKAAESSTSSGKGKSNAPGA